MVDTRIKVSSLVANQLPSFVREEFPLVGEFLSQYYLSLEGNGSTSNILENIDKYVKIDNLTNLTDSTVLSSDLDLFDDVIEVSTTYGFPQSYGLLQIDSEIITYTGITTNSFTGCIRGFSGVSSYKSKNKRDELVFSQTESSSHTSGSIVNNLSILFLKEFFNKVKKQISPGFENREFYSGLDERLFLKQSKDFYSSKGTDQSFEILFRSLYGEDVEVIKPRDYLFSASDAEYRITKDIVVEALEGNPEDLINRTLFQDETDFIKKASGSITDVQKIQRNNKNYYILSLDYDYDKDINVRGSVFGEFSIHPTTKLITSAEIGSTALDVDSTVGFPLSGNLIVDYPDGSFISVEYESKSLNQFFGCSGVTREINSLQSIRLNAFAYGYSSSSESDIVKVRVTGVLSDLELPPSTNYYESGDIIEIKNLGIGLTDTAANNWLFNIASSYDIKNITLQNNTNFSYNITTFDIHNFVLGDNAKITSSNGIEKTCKIISILNPYSFVIKDQGQLDLTKSYKIEKLLSKADIVNYPELNNYTTNVQNVYTDYENLYIASPSIPSYLNQPLNINNRQVKISGSFVGENLVVPNHGLYTGDSVSYSPIDESNTLGISSGIYFVKKIDDNTIKLSKSKANIFNNRYVSGIGTATDNILEYTPFVGQKLGPQKLIRKISNPISDGGDYSTKPGFTGILVNGVEILNYKSNDSIFYGPIEKINVTSNGQGYDVKNPPILQTSDLIGSGLLLHCEVEGNLERIDVIDGGFDYVDTPIVTITGGNGYGAVASANLISIEHSIDFNSSLSAVVDLSNNTVAFSTYHKFRDGELVIYKTNGQTSVGGLSTNSPYYLSIQDSYTVKFHRTYSDAISRNNEINLVSYGVGNHTVLASSKKKKIGSITVVNPGARYKNRKTTVNVSGINTASNTITIKDHKYNSGEIIYYTPGSSPISGLSTGNYYVTKIDNDNFKLSLVGTGLTSNDYFYRNNQYIKLESVGSGIHSFNYPEINVVVSGKIGVSTLTNQSFNAIVQPIFRGEIKSVFIENGGIGYGSSEILNYNRQPLFVLNNGSGAQLQPIIYDGKIKDVLVLNGGSGYNSIPDIRVSGNGQGAILVPIILNGSILSVKVISGGLGYIEANTKIDVISAGKDAKFESSAKKWTVNIFERIFRNGQIAEDDGVIANGVNSSFGLQYSHLYSPRKLRQSIFAKKIVNGQVTYIPDLQIGQNGKEVNSDTHSPIIGWAYDGNPIYGPYGYSTLNGGVSRLMRSGYKLKISTDRPNPVSSDGKSLYPDGFFVEDYSYSKSGDLDEYNGRFCITPEFPNGVYAYFTTLNPDSIESDLSFKNYRKPEFPYFIGNKFKSKPNEYNFSKYSNQDDINLTKEKIIRNTAPYNLTRNKSSYKYIIDPNKIQKQSTEIISVNYGEIQSVGIVTSGINYQVGDQIIFDNEDTFGTGANAKISTIGGKEIQSIVVDSSSISNVEFTPYFTESVFVGYATSPHGLKNFDVISISGLSTTGTNLQTFYNVGITTLTYILSNDVESSGVTGIITYFNVYGDLSYPNIRENDILGIGTEKIKVLNIDNISSRIRVQREYGNTVGTSHTASSLLTEDSRKVFINSYLVNNPFSYNISKELYFNPQETIGLGTVFGVGISSILVFSNPGIGISQISIPTRTLYLPNHNLNTGDQLIYNSNGGTSISVSTEGSSSFQLYDSQVVYAAKISNDLIGISTLRVGLGSTGSFVGIDSSITSNILYFTGIGTGLNHSFKTNPSNVLRGKISKNSATVSTASTHGLELYDRIYLNASPGITTTIVVTYNDYNRRLTIDPKSFSSSDINLIENSIVIINHGLSSGQKVIHNSTLSSGGLLNNKIYYVYVIDDNTIKLCSSITDVFEKEPIFIDITSASFGTISKVNPPIPIEKNQTILFDLSDSSLSFVRNSIRYSAFDFNIYYDYECKYPFFSSSNIKDFEVKKTGIVGVSTDANLTLKVSDSIPNNLYYKLEPINLDQNVLEKIQVINDNENIKNNNSLIVVDNPLKGYYTLSGIGSTTFTINLTNKPSRSQYNSVDGKFNYFTNSKTAYGPINSIEIISGGRNYKKLPGISSISSFFGNGAILLPQSNTIGKVLKTKIHDIGFDYPSDTTLRPEAQIPQILRIEPFSSFDRIGISSVGKNYFKSPNLVVIDGLTKKQIKDVDLKYNLGDKQVTIIKNTKNLSDKTPIIIPTNNVNGVTISSISYNTSTKDVTVSIGASFSSLVDFPFSVGDTVLIENISAGIGTTAKGYNSANYDYTLFEITQINPALGGSNSTITYNLADYLLDGEVPGVYDPINSSGKVIPSKYFPIFDVSLVKNDFSTREIVSSDSATGIVNSWDRKNGYLKVSSSRDFNSGETIFGQSSKSIARVVSVTKFSANYNVNSSSIVIKGWNKETGFLNNNLQRLHDNDYYQYFSYSIKSKVQYADWDDPVSSLNHTAGFKKFSDLTIESKDLINVGIETNQNNGDFIGISDIISFIDLNCVNDFDLASEKTINIDSKVYSDEIILKSRTIQDYIESVGNRVLIIDNISNQFNSNPRPTKFSIVDLFDLNSARSKKYITYVTDKRFTSERQILLVSLLHDNSFGFINQYGRVETIGDLGSFDFNISGIEGQLLFYPTKYRVNDYNINCVSYDIEDSISGIGTLDLGDTVKIKSNTKTIPVGFSTTTTIVSIASTYRTSKILVQYGAIDNSYFEYDEITIIHDNSEVELLEYGQLSTNILNSNSSIGLGTYSAYISGPNINIDFTPNVGLGVTYIVNSLQISIANTSSTGVSTSILNNSLFDCKVTNIPSSGSPVETVISEYEKPYSSAYYLVSIEDITNNQYQTSEIIVVDDESIASITEYAILQTGSNLGTFSANVIGNKTQLTFTAISGSNIQVRVFQNALRFIDLDNLNNLIDLDNASINTLYSTYESTESDIRRTFDLTSKGLPIFKRNFVGSASTIVDVTNNLIRIPNHYFVSGEELEYNYPGLGTTQAIGINTTFIVGIGTTDKLPKIVYAIKVDNTSIRIASSPENALKTIPLPLTISAVGIGTLHSFTSKKQNTKVLVSIDNVIQSPIVSTSITSVLSKDVLIADNTITVSGIASFFGGDLILINDEIMRIDSVGLGSTNVFLVKRPWMGTGISSHSSGTLVTKVNGNYNIVDNTINFITSPYGRTPIGTTSLGPDNVDYVGISTYSSFSGRVFLRSGIPNSTTEPYFDNYVFDDISTEFTGYTTSFNITSNGSSISGISTNNSIIILNQIFQQPQRLTSPISVFGDYTLKENLGITSIQFTGNISSTSYDVNVGNIPVGGVIVSVGSSKGFGYQPLVSAGGTAIVSGLGTISSISIGNSGSGYRSGLQTVRVGVQSVGLSTSSIIYIGTASVVDGNVVGVAITNPGIGFTSSNPPIVLFDSPLSYSNIPLTYSSSSAGIGTGAKINIVVGQGSSIVDFEITNFGYGYGQGDILTIGVGGTVGIPTNTSLPYKEFQIIVDRTYSDSFSGWSIGNLLVLDSIESLFNGQNTSFPISVNGQQKTIKAKSGSLIDVQATLLVFLNDILQVPGEGYLFAGGSSITFTEPPKIGDTCKILFYQGTSSVDVIDVDVLETVKIGDDVRLNDDNEIYQEDERTVTSINATDNISTNLYPGPGISVNENYLRSITWCKQTEDIFINETSITKDRILYEPLINPNTRLIQSVGIGSTLIFVESVKTFFDSNKENSNSQNKIRIISQDSLTGASATAVVSSAGTISSIQISNGGIGYTFAPLVTISNPIGLGLTQRAIAISSITSGIVTSINVSSPGYGYTTTNPPLVLVEEPRISTYTEDISQVSYFGDFGIISGISTVSVGVASTGIVFDLVIPKDSFLRNSDIVGSAITVSGIKTGYYFVVSNSNIGNGVISLRSNGSVVSIGSSFLDNVYEVASVSIAQTSAVGFGITYVAKVTVSVQNYNNITGLGYSNFFGEYSWGAISTPIRTNPKQFIAYNNGLTGISTSPIVQRYNPLKYSNYN